ncbi:MAG: hypothetical protein M1524_00860 [Patescibacteria group bacterium]|nr:hypothetical protein [Patescibacteria group bacterium]
MVNLERPELQSNPSRRIYYRGNIAVVESTEEDRSLYLGYLREVLSNLTEEAGGLEGWWVVGGIARVAVLGEKDFPVISPQGSFRDVDIVVSEDKKNIIHNAIKKDRTPIHFGGGCLQPVIRVNKGKDPVLQYGQVRVSVPSKTFETQIISLGGIDFPTLPTRTLLHLYGIGRHMREKDVLNAMALARYIRENPDPRYPEELYESFHEFINRKNRAGGQSVSGVLLKLAYLYRESPLNNIVPITQEGCLSKILMGIWQKTGDLERAISTKTSEVEHPTPQTSFDFLKEQA